MIYIAIGAVVGLALLLAMYLKLVKRHEKLVEDVARIKKAHRDVATDTRSRVEEAAANVHARLEEKAVEIQHRLDETMEQVEYVRTDLRPRIEQLEPAVADLSAKVEERIPVVNEAGARVERVEERLTQAEDKAAEAARQSEDASERLAANEARVAELIGTQAGEQGTRIERMEEAVRVLRNTTEERLRELAERVSTLEERPAPEVVAATSADSGADAGSVTMQGDVWSDDVDEDDPPRESENAARWIFLVLALLLGLALIANAIKGGA